MPQFPPFAKPKIFGQHLQVVTTGCVHTVVQVGAHVLHDGAGGQQSAKPIVGAATKKAKAVNVFFIFFLLCRYLCCLRCCSSYYFSIVKRKR